MLINMADDLIMPEAFYLLAPSGDIKLRIRILDPTLFITQFELKPLFF